MPANVPSGCDVSLLGPWYHEKTLAASAIVLLMRVVWPEAVLTSPEMPTLCAYLQTLTVAVALSTVLQTMPLPTRTQYVAFAVSAGVVNVALVALATGDESSPLWPAYH